MSMVEVPAITCRLLRRCGDLSYSQAWEAACRVMLMRREVDRLQRRQQEIEALAYEAERSRMLREIAARFEATASKFEREVVAAMRGAAIETLQAEEMGKRCRLRFDSRPDPERMRSRERIETD